MQLKHTSDNYAASDTTTSFFYFCSTGDPLQRTVFNFILSPIVAIFSLFDKIELQYSLVRISSSVVS